MNFIKRAFLSVRARKGKSLILFTVFLVVANLTLAGFAMQNVTETASDLARKKLGVEVTLGLDHEKLQKHIEKQVEENPNERINIPEISTDEADKLAKSSYVKKFNYLKEAYGLTDGFKPIEVDEKESEGAVAFAGGGQNDDREMPNIAITGVRSSDLLKGFTEGTEKIIKGRPITAEDKGKKVALIEKQLAKQNKLKVGDKVKIKTDDGKSKIKVEIIGIYESHDTSQKPPIAFMNPSNKIYVTCESLKGFSQNKDMKGTPIDSAAYYLTDPDHIDAFKALGKKTDIDFDLFKLDAHDALYKKMVGPIENMATTSKWIVYMVSITGSIILGLIIMLTIKERRKELGILLAIGEKKGKLIGQLLVEVVCIAVLAFSLSIFTGGAVSQKMGDNLLQKEITASEEQENNSGQQSQGMVTSSASVMDGDLDKDVDPIDNIDVSVTSQDILNLGGLGLLIAILATLLPALSILRLNPKDILLKDE
ncbi:ABC transporter permease [Viridibacillus sp. NPDC096237]|uniref:ABC transporter permease n=1 Tax=Viridibacillus sp. NPDC096237 TaxID=3390721 RepID=UPI003CFEA853